MSLKSFSDGLLWLLLPLFALHLPSKGTGFAKVFISITFEFNSEEARQSDVYKSLEPRLLLPDNSMLQPETENIEDGQLKVRFVLDGLKSQSEIPKELRIDLGPRLVRFVSRPVVWRVDAREHRRIGEMSPVLLLRQPDPDWVIVRRAVWLTSPEGSVRLTIDLQNLSQNPHPGGSLFFGAADGKHSCHGEIGRSEIAVSLAVRSGKLTISSSDPEFNDPIKRKVMLTIDPCNSSNFEFELGETGGIAGGELLRIRYLFPDRLPVETVTTTGPNDVSGGVHVGSQMTVSRLLGFESRYIDVEGDHMYPKRLIVEVP